ncbi:hypothetical protein ACHAXT_010874 [Thalassiosira profunda]
MSGPEPAATPASPAAGFRDAHKLSVDVAAINNDEAAANSKIDDGHRHDPKTPPGMRGHLDPRAPGFKQSPLNADDAAGRKLPFSNNEDGEENHTASTAEETAGLHAAAPPNDGEPPSPLADFITQTDRHGNATTPRSADAISMARRMHPSGPKPRLHVDGETGALTEESEHADGETAGAKTAEGEVGAVGGEDACDTLLDSFRMMCCCLLPEDHAHGSEGGEAKALNGTATSPPTPASDACDGAPGSYPIGYSTRGHDAPPLLEEHSALRNGNDPHRIRLLPELHADDRGKKCLVLDLDETLVHSSFRAVPGADFVIPVQIEDVVHFVYVAKRPGVDEFLLEMAKHYEIVVYTASLNKYADVLLDLLDPHRVVRTRLFRESCVFYEGNYIKDLSLLNREMGQTIIIDNSPASYLFHPENAIDCTSFIDDVSDRELDHIGKFLVGLKDVDDVRGTVNLWRHWPNVDLTKSHRRIR